MTIPRDWPIFTVVASLNGLYLERPNCIDGSLMGLAELLAVVLLQSC